jgi:hypothetical protein
MTPPPDQPATGGRSSEEDGGDGGGGADYVLAELGAQLAAPRATGPAQDEAQGAS